MREDRKERVGREVRRALVCEEVYSKTQGEGELEGSCERNI